jgi:hypothetical protein
VDVLLPKQGMPLSVLLRPAALVPRTFFASSLSCLRGPEFVVQSRDHDQPLDVLQREGRRWWVYLRDETFCWHYRISGMDLTFREAY